ncbi:MAG: TonB-dependent receptor [Luminiphilus sp.]|nr:TonB-dependent receptor [Luminiphilus sp.]
MRPTYSSLPTQLASLVVALAAIGLPAVSIAQPLDEQNELESVIVTASRLPLSALGLPVAWSVVEQSVLERIAPQHSNQVFNRVAGAWVSRGNGQESLVSLRSPVLTGAGSCGAFMTAQDGISLRSPGFCNVNQLFDANLLQAGKVEVLKGPATVVFGSNAQHGIINVLTRPVSKTPNQVRLEAGARDFYRVSASGTFDSIALSAQSSHYGGYQDASGYDQQKATVRIDHGWQDWRLSGALESNHLDQETAGYIRGFEAYEDDDARKENPNPEAYRNAWSGRGYLSFSRGWGQDAEFTVRPYWRSNNMTFLQHYLPWKATETNRHRSLGLQTIANGITGSMTWLAGVDIDHTRGSLLETQAEFFSPNQPDGIHYDYEVDAETLAGFSHVSWQLADRWNLAGGVRLEETRYDYSNRTDSGPACAPTASACRFFRPAGRKDHFTDWTGNLAISHQTENTTVYGRLARGFRAPQTTELYRLQSGQRVAEINSENMNTAEVGIRGSIEGFGYDLAAYWMTKEDVIFQDRDRYNVSGAETIHRGVEASLSWRLSDVWSVKGNGSYARHRYDSDIQLLGSRGSIEGNEIDTAPKHFGSIQLLADFSSLAAGLSAELEWLWVAQYWLDPNNQHQYDGHELLNFRAAWKISSAFTVTLVATNLLDEGYAERADFGFGSYRYFVGEPRSAVVGVTMSF